MVIAIDPGNRETGYAIMDMEFIKEFGILQNDDMLAKLKCVFTGAHCTHLYFEMVACYGMPVGASVFDTCVWIGRFVQIAKDRHFGVTPVYRKDVKNHLCNRMQKATDANIRQAILDIYPQTGGGKVPQIGIKKQPGPLFGVSKHVWPAIAVGLTGQKVDTTPWNVRHDLDDSESGDFVFSPF